MLTQPAHPACPTSTTASPLHTFAPCLVTPLGAASHVLLLPQGLPRESCLAAAQAQAGADALPVTLVLGADQAWGVDPLTLAVAPARVPRPAAMCQGLLAPAAEHPHALEDEMRLLRLRECCD